MGQISLFNEVLIKFLCPMKYGSNWLSSEVLVSFVNSKKQWSKCLSTEILIQFGFKFVQLVVFLWPTEIHCNMSNILGRITRKKSAVLCFAPLG